MFDLPERLMDKLESLKPKARAAVDAAEIALTARLLLRLDDPACVPREDAATRVVAEAGLPVTHEQARDALNVALHEAYLAVKGLGDEVLWLLESHFSTDGQPGRKLLQDLMAAALGTGGVCWALPVADSDLAGAVVRLRDAVEGLKNATQPPPPSAAERRNRLIYEHWMGGTPAKQIRSVVNKQAAAEGWDALETDQAVKLAAVRFAERNALAAPPDRKKGRPRP